MRVGGAVMWLQSSALLQPISRHPKCCVTNPPDTAPYLTVWTTKKKFLVICSSFVAGVPLHRQHCNRYSVHNATPCSKTRCCVVLPRKLENKHKRERSCSKICTLLVLKSLESTEDFQWQNLFVHKKFPSTKSFLYVACHPLYMWNYFSYRLIFCFKYWPQLGLDPC